MKLLRVVLFLAAILCLSGIVGIIAPVKEFSVLAQRYGAAGGLDTPFFKYLLRIFAAVVVGCGVFFLFLAKNPKKHGLLVPASGLALVFAALVALAAGAQAGVPFIVYFFDFLGCFVLGAAIVGLWFAARKSAAR